MLSCRLKVPHAAKALRGQEKARDSRHTQASAKQRSRRSLALQRPPVSQGRHPGRGHPQTLLQIYPGEKQEAEGVQLISAEQWNVLGNLCAQEDRTLPRGLYLLELRLTIPGQKPEQPLRRNSRLQAVKPTFKESFHSSSYRTMDALSALPSSHSSSQSDHCKFQ